MLTASSTFETARLKKTKPWLTRAGAAVVAVLFFILNRGAYRSFFQDDEFDTLSWIADPPLSAWLRGLFTPVFDPNNFRPPGDFYYFLLHSAFGFQFRPYVLVLQLAHLLNVFLLWRLARKLGISVFGAYAGALFFAFNMAAIDAFWKPMYIFDVLCATFCLASVLLFAKGRWVWSFAAFWLAYKSKEVAVMLPLALAGYELWFGDRRRRWTLLPFFVVSLSFGGQAMIANQTRQDLYAFHFTWDALMQTAAYYSSRILLVPYAGAGLLVLPFVFRDNRVRWGVASMLLLFVPLLLLPSRIFCAYTYVPLAFLSVALAAIAGARRPVFTLLFFLLWMPLDIQQLRADRRTMLAAAEESRPYFEDVVNFARTHRKPAALLYDGLPVGYHVWGVTGIFRCAFGDPVLEATYLHDPAADKLMQSGSFAILIWDKPHRKATFVAAASKP
jgi:hypothetical protein